jgi:hypothetical protein
MSIENLEILVGEWRITGRSTKADHDDVTGELKVRPILDGHVLELTGTTRVGDFAVPSLELIWPTEDGEACPAHVYSTQGEPLNYRWQCDGKTLIHAGRGATYTGTISEDRSTIAGAWRADEGQPVHPGSNYEATMHRVRVK